MAEIDEGRRRFLTGVSTGVVGTLVVAASPGALVAPEAEAAPATKEASADLLGPGKVIVTLNINGREERIAVEPRTTLLDLLREQLDLTGAKRTCDRGECGACTVIVDGEPVYACLTLAVMADGRKVETIEGLRQGEKLHPVQEAFFLSDAFQCGFCTPGMMMAAKALLDGNPNPTAEEIRRGMSGNLCRCGSYPKIFQAVAMAAKTTKA